MLFDISLRLVGLADNLRTDTIEHCVDLSTVLCVLLTLAEAYLVQRCLVGICAIYLEVILPILKMIIVLVF